MLDLTGFPPTRERQNRINPRFLKEFQRLKEDENLRLSLA